MVRAAASEPTRRTGDIPAPGRRPDDGPDRFLPIPAPRSGRRADHGSVRSLPIPAPRSGRHTGGFPAAVPAAELVRRHTGPLPLAAPGAPTPGRCARRRVNVFRQVRSKAFGASTAAVLVAGAAASVATVVVAVPPGPIDGAPLRTPRSEALPPVPGATVPLVTTSPVPVSFRSPATDLGLPAGAGASPAGSPGDALAGGVIGPGAPGGPGAGQSGGTAGGQADGGQPGGGRSDGGRPGDGAPGGGPGGGQPGGRPGGGPGGGQSGGGLVGEAVDGVGGVADGAGGAVGGLTGGVAEALPAPVEEPVRAVGESGRRSLVTLRERAVAPVGEVAAESTRETSGTTAAATRDLPAVGSTVADTTETVGGGSGTDREGRASGVTGAVDDLTGSVLGGTSTSGH